MKVREFVLRVSSDSKLSEKALQSLELRDLVAQHFRTIHILSDVTVDTETLEHELFGVVEDVGEEII